MIFTLEKCKVVYVARDKDKNVIYVGRGDLERPLKALLTPHLHSMQLDQRVITEVEILGPYTIEESVDVERQLIEEYKKIYELRNIKMNKFASLNEKAEHIVKDLRESNLSQTAIARKHGVSRQYVWNLKNDFVKNC